MNIQEIKEAVSAGKTVHWSNDSYKVIKDKNSEYLISHDNGSATGLHGKEGGKHENVLNGEESKFYIEGEQS